MLRVTADIFSGRPNPTWIIEESQDPGLLPDLAKADRVAGMMESGFQGLGNRGLIVDVLGDNLAAAHGLPATFRVASGIHREDATLAERLIDALTSETERHPAANFAERDGFENPSLADFKAYLLDTLPEHRPVTTTHDGSHRVDHAIDAATAAGCSYETVAFDPAYWNDPAHIRLNNCYAFGANRRTDTFPQPGRASGHPYAALTCTAVAQAAVSDGATQNCAPDDQKPRWYMALVIAPGPVFKDYHWYRKQTEGYWAHKPGQTAAKNTDNSGHVILDPQTCDRGPYTTFCGYMFAQKKMVIS